MKKGTLITVTKLLPLAAWRTSTHEEREEWYRELAQRVKEGKDVPYDCAGESKLAPMSQYRDLVPGTRLLVMRARVAAPRGYYTVSKCIEVVNLDTGEALFLEKRDLLGSAAA